MNTAEVETVSPPKSFDTHHDDHDAKVDFYGRKLATASSDRTIRIFQINEMETETLLSILSGHEGPVWQVAWAHPKFGSILASCSYDGSVIIWQEDKQQKLQNAAGTHSTWTKLKVHRVHDSSVNSISFAPHAFGLHLACASSDGKVSILSQVGDEWQTQIISAHSTGCNSVSWAPSALPSSLFSVNFGALDEKPVPLGPKMIATGGCDNNVKLWKAVEEEGQEKWTLEATLDDHADWVRDVCWRPNLGQVGHMLVSCSQDKTVLIWKFNEELKKWESRPLKQQPFPDTLWRVSFSEYGHLLAVSCGDNTVTIWRENFDDGTWELAGNVNETVTETVKIEEPLAVAPPASAPIPEIQFTSSKTPKIVADVGYMKPMSPMMPAPTLTSANSTPGYQQFNQEYDDYQNAQTPSIPIFSHPLINSGILASTVIAETVSENVHRYDHPSGYYPEPQPQDQHDQQQQQQQYSQYTQAVEEFNKDIGFMTSQQEQSEPNFEQPVFEQPIYEQPYEEQANYEQVDYDQSSYDQAAYEPAAYDQTAYEQPAYEQASYDQTAYGQSTFETTSYEHEQPTANQETYEQAEYEQVNYGQADYEQVNYEQPSFEQPSYEYEQVNYYGQQSSYDPSQQSSYDPSSYYQVVQQPQQETYDSYAAEPVVQEQEQQDLQYENYNNTSASADATGF